jgi:hypothetical protein
MFFKKKSNGRLVVVRDVTWAGATVFDAYRFDIDKDGQRYEFVVPYACGNFTLRSVGPVPPPPKAAAPPPPPAPVAKAAPAPPVVPPAPPAPKAVVPPAPPAPAPPPPAPVVPKPVAVAAAAPVVPPPPPVAPPAPAPVAKPLGGPVIDVGLSRQLDPANYVFARVGYEVPLTGRLYLLGLVGGQVRWMGNDGGSAFTADVLLDFHWMGNFELGAGVGYWSGNDGQLDLIADAGYLVAGTPDGGNTSLFLEARLPADELDNVEEFGRVGLGLRFRF